MCNLACREVFGSHTAVNIQSWISDIQSDFKIEDNQILALTIDSAKNMTAAADGYIEEIEQNMDCDQYSLFTDEEYISNHSLDANIFSEISFDEVEDEEFSILESEEDPEEDPEKLKLAFRIHCAAHKLQLAVNSFLKTNSIGKTLTVARSLAVKLRTSLIRSKITSEKLNVPCLDQATRWNSTQNMICQVLALEEFCKRHQDADIPG